jgi:Trk K+ transport system NAD-binding subunit
MNIILRCKISSEEVVILACTIESSLAIKYIIATAQNENMMSIRKKTRNLIQVR